MTSIVVDSEDTAKLIAEQKIRGPVKVDGLLDLTPFPEVKKLPKGLSCFELDASRTAIKSIPEDIRVECSFVIRSCRHLKKLPDKLKTGTLDVSGCNSLEELPEGLDVWFLQAAGCTSLKNLPRKCRISNGGLGIAGCFQIRELPKRLDYLSTLDISDCPLIDRLPPNLDIGLWVDVAGSGIKTLPPHLKEIGIRWRGVEVDERIAFHPESITADEVTNEKNAERRRVLMEQMGIDKYFEASKAKCINKDTDPGGERKLLRIKVTGDEDVVCLSCSCPSTGRNYMLRVPPNMKTCRQAAAWMAGFDSPKKYNPVIET